MNTLTTVEIPADVRDNSETVTDYAFMRHRSPDKGVRTPDERDRAIDWSDRHGYVHMHSYDVNPGGQRCRFDVLYNVHGVVVNFFHTQYFTRVTCITDDASYASRYASVIDQDGMATVASPYCGFCLVHLHRSAEETGMTVRESEPLYIGQHD